MTTNEQNAAPLIDISRSQIRTDQPSNPHEPECTATDIYAQDCICQRLHTAYQRGREDAGKAIRELHKPVEGSPTSCVACQECWGCGEWGDIDDCPCGGGAYPCSTIKALDGEQE